MSTSTTSEPTLTEVLLQRGFKCRPVGEGPFREIVRISNLQLVATLKAHEAWEFVREFDRKGARNAKRRLTPDQAAKVSSLISDSGYTRAEADAWVRAFEPGDIDAILDVTLGAELAAVSS